MTAKEKAKELFDKYNQIKHSVSIPLNKKRTRKCALICIDEMISELEWLNNFEDKDRVVFWKEVKREIEKL